MWKDILDLWKDIWDSLLGTIQYAPSLFVSLLVVITGGLIVDWAHPHIDSGPSIGIATQKVIPQPKPTRLEVKPHNDTELSYNSSRWWPYCGVALDTATLDTSLVVGSLPSSPTEECGYSIAPGSFVKFYLGERTMGWRNNGSCTMFVNPYSGDTWSESHCEDACSYRRREQTPEDCGGGKDTYTWCENIDC